MPMNHSIAENFMRSAKAPVMSAGVMMAKVSWNMQKTDLRHGLHRAAQRVRRDAHHEGARQHCR